MKYMEFKWYCLMKPMRGLEAKTGSSFSYVCIPWTLITTELDMTMDLQMRQGGTEVGKLEFTCFVGRYLVIFALMWHLSSIILHKLQIVLML